MKKINNINLLYGLFAILIIVGCSSDSENDGPTLSVQPSTITLEADGSGKTISVTSNTSWTVRADDSWVKYSPTGGTGGSSITVSALVNTGDERSSKLTLSDKTGRATAEVHITQKKADSSTPTPTSEPALTVKPSSISFSSSAGSNTFVIESNISWTVRSDQTWCTVNTSSGSNNATITVNVTENTSTSARNATITVSSDKVSSVQISISQSGANPTLQVNKSELPFNASGGSDTFIVTSNTSWSITSNQTWCTINTSSGSNNATIIVKVSENTSTQARSAIITVGYNNNSVTISVNQEAAEASLILSTTSVSFPYSPSGKSVTIKSNTSWKASSSENWLTVSPSQGNGNGTLTLTVLENTTNSERNAIVTVDYDNTNATIAVSQEASYSETRIGTDIICTLYGVSFKMIGVNGTSFYMGATEEQEDDAFKNESPSGEVALESYYICETEVTQELWQAVMGFNPSWFFGLKRPVESVSWNDCQEFIIKLNELTGQRFRLPTEAEWECAARGAHGWRGGYFKYAGSDTINDFAWYNDNSNGVTHDVALKSPNEIGLYDMSGNVEEWCQDWYGEYDLYDGRAVLNPTGPSSGNYRVIRGGGFDESAIFCRVSARSIGVPDRKSNRVGLRLAR